jgi:hypothetical protein
MLLLLARLSTSAAVYSTTAHWVHEQQPPTRGGIASGNAASPDHYRSRDDTGCCKVLKILDVMISTQQTRLCGQKAGLIKPTLQPTQYIAL